MLHNKEIMFLTIVYIIVYIIELIILIYFSKKNGEKRKTFFLNPLLAIFTAFFTLLAIFGAIVGALMVISVIYYVATNLPDIFQKIGFGICVFSALCVVFAPIVFIIQIFENGIINALKKIPFYTTLKAYEKWDSNRTKETKKVFISELTYSAVFIIGICCLIKEFMT